MDFLKHTSIIITLLGIFIAFKLFGNEVSAQESDGAVTRYAANDKVQIANYDKIDKLITCHVDAMTISIVSHGF